MSQIRLMASSDKSMSSPLPSGGLGWVILLVGVGRPSGWGGRKVLCGGYQMYHSLLNG